MNRYQSRSVQRVRDPKGAMILRNAIGLPHPVSQAPHPSSRFRERGSLLTLQKNCGRSRLLAAKAHLRSPAGAGSYPNPDRDLRLKRVK